MITIVDYGMGNVGSIANMLKELDETSIITDELEEIRQSKKLILPGVGSFDKATNAIRQSGLLDALDYAVHQREVPLLGICLGMQILSEESEEGDTAGLGWIPGKTKRFSQEDKPELQVPHMGWNSITVRNNCALTQDLPEDPRFYFAHSYYVEVENDEHSIMETNYSIKFNSGIKKDNIYGVQFHPEKSHKYGLSLLKNFIRI
jgi:glutamine amidotransferase